MKCSWPPAATITLVAACFLQEHFLPIMKSPTVLPIPETLLRTAHFSSFLNCYP